MDAKQLQAFLDGMKGQWQRERSETQMTLGGLIERLKALPPEMKVHGVDPTPISYRGYYEDLCFQPSAGETTVAALLEQCQAAMGAAFEGYKGGEFYMNAKTPLWLSCYGTASGTKIMGFGDDGRFVVVDEQP